MRILSWNVNGLRACAKKGFAAFLDVSGADVLGLQEVRAFPEQLPEDIRKPPGWWTHFHPAERPGYSGVALYSRALPDKVDIALGEPDYDQEGRFIVAYYGEIAVANVYFPKGSGRDRDNSRVPYKLGFYQTVFARIETLRERYRVFVIGDYNTAHTEIDLARPKTNKKTSGFLPEEREEMDRWLTADWIDTFRSRHPGIGGHYTWWRQWGGARENNVGWRIDYVLASRKANERITQAFIWPHTLGSDHCPVGVDVDIDSPKLKGEY